MNSVVFTYRIRIRNKIKLVLFLLHYFNCQTAAISFNIIANKVEKLKHAEIQHSTIESKKAPKLQEIYN